ncbi:MAG: sulfatase-like hydrolase/transferase [Acidobacteria bacterium]|nr:sulfatase-like hydrolase/transferase [Acidobacteriota bacterium]
MFRLAHFALVLLVCASGEAQPSTPVILISVDTLRADHLGCYQAGIRQSPHIDSLARNGTLFSQVSSPVPLTLPSHVAMFTSTYPFANSVQDNGVPLAITTATLATVLNNVGYRTAAFVGGFALDRRFGLSRGFEVYDSPFDLHKKTTRDFGDLKRPGAEVAAAAMHWLDQHAKSPFFLFLHLYDLHTPYDLPAEPRLRRGETGYEAELSYVDQVLGDFLTFLEGRDLLNKSLIVFVSDHGEGLNQHGESTHGYFVYQSTLRVPLIIHWPKGERRPPNNRMEEPASLLDVTPTILDVLGIPRAPEMRGRSLIAGMDREEIYSESFYARNHFGCAALRTLRVGRYKYIDAIKPELYDLSSDPLELRNLFNRERSRAIQLRQRLSELAATIPAASPRTPAPDAANLLRSLGYLSGPPSASSQSEPGIDPKDRIDDFELYGQALALASAGRLTESSSLLEKLAKKLPDVVEIRISQGLNHQQSGQDAEAVQDFKRALEEAPLNALAHFDLALSEFRLQRPDEAVNELQATLSLEPWYTRAEELLVDIYLKKKDYVRARALLQHLLSVDPRSYTAHYDLGVLAAIDLNWSEAQLELLSALDTDPGSAEAHNALGSVYLQRGQLEPARGELEKAIRLEPEFAWAHYNLALVLKQQEKMDDAERELRAALRANPHFPAARAELDRMAASRP